MAATFGRVQFALGVDGAINTGHVSALCLHLVRRSSILSSSPNWVGLMEIIFSNSRCLDWAPSYT